MKRRDRRDRRTLAWLAASLLVTYLGLAFAVERSWPDVRDPDWAELMARLRQRRAEDPGRELVVILGSSRSMSSLDAAWLSRRPDGPLVFNASLSGAGPLMQQAALERLAAEGIRPDRVVLEVLPAFYGRHGALFEEGTLRPQRLTLAEVLAATARARRPERLFRPWLRARLLPLTAHHAALQRRLLPEALWCRTDEVPAQGRDGHGFFALPVDADEAHRADQVRFIVDQYRLPLKETQLDEARPDMLHAMLRGCRARGIEPVLYVGPEHTCFRQTLAEELGARITHLLGEAGRRGLAVFDAREWVPDREFIDGHHADVGGAARVSRRLEAEALRSGRLSRR